MDETAAPIFLLLTFVSLLLASCEGRARPKRLLPRTIPAWQARVDKFDDSFDQPREEIAKVSAMLLKSFFSSKT